MKKENEDYSQSLKKINYIFLVRTRNATFVFQVNNYRNVTKLVSLKLNVPVKIYNERYFGDPWFI